MNSVSLSASLGLIIMTIVVLFIPRESESFNKLFGFGIGLTLTYVLGQILMGIRSLVNSFRKNKQ